MSEYATAIITALFATQTCAFLLLLLLKQIFSNLSEKVIIRITANMALASVLLNFALAIVAIKAPQHRFIIDLGTWFRTEEGNYEIGFVIDALSITYGLFSTIMIGLVIIFSRRYLHREKGYYRFFTFMTLFTLGVNLVSFAGNLEIIIIGWEFVGLASMLLISFFNYRFEPVKNAFWVFVNYRLCDIGLFAAVLLMRSALHSSDFQPLDSAIWLGLTAHNAPMALGFLILFAAMGKSALFPFSGWLPRAMEGPTPSSAIFYGSISIHFGAFLLLRSADLIAASPYLAASIIAIGLLTAAIARLVAHVQSDVKSMIAYEAVMQVGLIIAEIGLGLHLLALLHILGHSCFRTMQFLRAPSMIHDLRNIEQMLGHSLSLADEKKCGRIDYFLYRFALEKGCADNIVKDVLLRFFLFPFRKLDQLERALSKRLFG